MNALYRAFGLTIGSEIPLVELPPGSGTRDVEVVTGRVNERRPDGDGWTIHARPGEVSGWAPAAGGYRVSEGREIVVDPAPDADERAVRMAIVGPLLGVILLQRDAFVLHASTVAIGGRAVAFAGPSGRGKSTLTAALTQAGHRLVAEDMTVIDAAGAHPVVVPGFPRLKLWPDSAAALDHDAAALPLLHPMREKRSLQLETFHPEPMPLARCFLLEDGDEEAIRVPSPTEAVLALVRCTYQAQWLDDCGASRANLVHCGALVRSGTVRILNRRRSFASLPAVVEFVKRQISELGYEP